MQSKNWQVRILQQTNKRFRVETRRFDSPYTGWNLTNASDTYESALAEYEWVVNKLKIQDEIVAGQVPVRDVTPRPV